MERTLFDNYGNAIAYIAHNDEDTVYLWGGKPVAYVKNSNQIYGFNGKHLGWYEGDIVRNLAGEKVGFNNKSLPVFSNFEPFKSFKEFKPFKGFTEFAHNKPFYKNTQSGISLSDFFLAGI
jgi:hypothetical protein